VTAARDAGANAAARDRAKSATQEIRDRDGKLVILQECTQLHRRVTLWYLQRAVNFVHRMVSIPDQPEELVGRREGKGGAGSRAVGCEG
jgi:hypothetical protein